MKYDTEINEFIVQGYSKQELAMLYFPNCPNPHVAVNRLTRWIQRCQPLKAELEAVHYCKYAKFFTPREVALIVSYIGEPVETVLSSLR